MIIECDGSPHADSDYDAARDAWLREQGSKALRFWNSYIVEQTANVAESILRELGRDQ